MTALQFIASILLYTLPDYFEAIRVFILDLADSIPRQCSGDMFSAARSQRQKRTSL